GDIYVVYIRAADRIRGHIDFTRPQRKPANVDAGGKSACAESDGEMRSPDPRHQRRRIHRTHVDYSRRRRRTRYPAPHSADKDPASVVKWRKTPRSIINPGVAPRINVSPMSVAVGRPADDGRMREPHCSVSRHRPPAAVLVQVLIANHVRRY